MRLDQFIFCEADYIKVAIREINEITEIFGTYEIELHKLRNQHLYQKPLRKDEENHLEVIKESYEKYRQQATRRS